MQSFRHLVPDHSIFKCYIFRKNLFDQNRKRFLTSNRVKVSVEICINESIDVIKFIGRQHAFLTDITDQLNVCYGFQVWYSFELYWFHWKYLKGTFLHRFWSVRLQHLFLLCQPFTVTFTWRTWRKLLYQQHFFVLSGSFCS